MQHLIVGLIFLVAFAFLIRHIRSELRGKPSCGCPGAKTCPRMEQALRATSPKR